MASTRDFKAPVIFAENADTVIPPTPTQGQSYRDVANTTEQLINDGMKYNTIADSATLFNQFQYLLTRFSQEVEQTGLLGWSELVDYKLHARSIGSDGVEYRAKVANGPNAGGVADPISSSTEWQEVRPQLSIGETLFLVVDNTPTEQGYIGTWVQVEAGASLGAVDAGDAAIGTITGDNNPAVPLLEHNHTATFSGNSLPPHSHPNSFFVPSSGQLPNGADSGNQHLNNSTSSVTAGTPSGTVTVNNAGDPPGAFSVQGKVLNGVWWKRTA